MFSFLLASRRVIFPSARVSGRTGLGSKLEIVSMTSRPDSLMQDTRLTEVSAISQETVQSIVLQEHVPTTVHDTADDSSTVSATVPEGSTEANGFGSLHSSHDSTTEGHKYVTQLLLDLNIREIPIKLHQNMLEKT